MNKKILLIFLLSGLIFNTYSQTHNLDYYLSEGLRNSPLLTDYRNQEGSAIADSLLIRAAVKPKIEAQSFLQYSPLYGKFGYDEVITDGGNYSAVVGVSQNIFNKMEITNKLEAADLLKQSILNESKISATLLSREITSQYLVTFTGYDDYLFNLTFLELFHKENEIVKEFVKNGICKQTDYLSLLVETQSQEILVTQLKNQYRKELMFLNQLCGLSDTVSYQLTAPQIEIKGVPAFEKTPAYLQYKIDSVRIKNEKLAIDINYKPKVSWFADAGILTHTPFSFYKHVGYSAGLSLNIPIYDGKQREIQKQKLEFSESSRQTYESNYRTQFSIQTKRLNDELKNLDELSIKMKKQLQTSDLLVKALKQQLESGIVQMTDYLISIKNFKTTGRNLNLIEIQKLQVINEMNFLLTQ